MMADESADSPLAFEYLLSSYQAAATRGIEVHHACYTVAQHIVCIRVVGPRLADALLPSLSHLRKPYDGATPHLKIDVWDERETSVSCPVALSEGHSMVVASDDGRYISQRGPNTRIVLDRRAHHIVGSFASVETLSRHDRARPFNKLLSLWLKDRGTQVIHAAMVSQGGNGIIFGGKGGTGKSTSAIACLCGALDFLGDDLVILEEKANHCFVGHSLYSSTFLEPEQLAWFPQLCSKHAIGDPSGRDKSLVLISQLFPSQLRRHATIRAVALPRVRPSSQSRARPATKGEALLALAPSTLTSQIGPRPRDLHQLGRLVECLPCHWLELGRKLEEIPQVVRTLLREVSP